MGPTYINTIPVAANNLVRDNRYFVFYTKITAQQALTLATQVLSRAYLMFVIMTLHFEAT
jgi:hypothetical protein